MGEMADYFIERDWDWDAWSEYVRDGFADAETIVLMGRDAIWYDRHGQAVRVRDMTDKHVCFWLRWYARELADEVREGEVLWAFAKVIQDEYDRRFGALQRMFKRKTDSK